MQEYLIISGKTVLFYLTLIITMRIMGKREVGELSIFDLVVFFIISEMLSNSISNAEENVLLTLVPIVILVTMQKVIAYIVLKSIKARKLIEGKQSYIIKHGIIDQKAMKDNRYNIDDLMFQLRDKDIDSPSKVDFAVLENDGTLSIIKNAPDNVKYPDPLIEDGKIDEESLNAILKTKAWLINELKEHGHPAPENIFLCMLEKNGLYVVPKQLS